MTLVKKITVVFLIVFVMIFFVFGCAEHLPESQNLNENKLENDKSDSQELSEESERRIEEVLPPTDVEISDKSAVVSYYGEEF